jgi:mannitol/fructose-specific phosphotransferase system IIA component (Ntr-type)
MNLAKMLKKELIFIANTFEDTDDFYTAYSLFLKEKGVIVEHENVKRLFIKRENLQSTAIGKGAAAPHIYSDEFSQFIFSAALIREGLDFKAPNKGKVYFVFLIMSDENGVQLHLKTLAHIARLIKSTDIVEEVKQAGDEDEILRILKENEAKIK